jgi:hypothetical protein
LHLAAGKHRIEIMLDSDIEGMSGVISDWVIELD